VVQAPALVAAALVPALVQALVQAQKVLEQAAELGQH